MNYKKLAEAHYNAGEKHPRHIPKWHREIMVSAMTPDHARLYNTTPKTEQKINLMKSYKQTIITKMASYFKAQNMGGK